MTTENIAHPNAPIELVQGSYKDLIAAKKYPADHRVVVFLGPPWGDALQPVTGLHLDQTKPPILEIVRDFEQVYGSQPVLYVTEVHEVNEAMSLKAVQASFDWSDLRIYVSMCQDFNMVFSWGLIAGRDKGPHELSIPTRSAVGHETVVLCVPTNVSSWGRTVKTGFDPNGLGAFTRLANRGLRH